MPLIRDVTSVGDLGVKMNVCKDRFPMRQGALYSGYAPYIYEYLRESESPRMMPYSDEDIDLRRNIYVNAKHEGKGDVREPVVNKFISRVMLSTYMSDDDGGFGINHIDDGRVVPGYIPPAPTRIGSDPNRLARRKDKKGRKNKTQKVEEAPQYKGIPPGSRVSVAERTFTVGVDDFRCYVNEELNSRARVIHEFYDRQWQQLHADKLDSLRELVACQENLRLLQKEKETADNEIYEYKKTTENLTTKLNTATEAKKRRRQSKKQRKAAGSQYLSGSRDDGSCPDVTSAAEDTGTLSE